jgi:hypothetical protein
LYSADLLGTQAQKEEESTTVLIRAKLQLKYLTIKIVFRSLSAGYSVEFHELVLGIGHVKGSIDIKQGAFWANLYCTPSVRCQPHVSLVHVNFPVFDFQGGSWLHQMYMVFGE